MNELTLLIGSFTALVAAITAFIIQVTKSRGKIMKLRSTNQELISENERLRLARSASYFPIDSKTMVEIARRAHDMITETNIDRFLILSSVNKKNPVNHFSVNWVIDVTLPMGRSQSDDIILISDEESDQHYVEMLHYVEQTGLPYVGSTPELPRGSKLREIYEERGIEHFLVFFGFREEIDEDNHRLRYYAYHSHDKDMVINKPLQRRLTAESKKTTEDLLASGMFNPINRN